MLPHKKFKQSLNLEVKLEIIKRHEMGQRQRDIAVDMQLAPSTVSSICSRDAKKIKKCAESGIPLTETMVNRHNKSKVLYDMEEILDQWVERQMHENKRLTHVIIRKKAISIYNELLEKEGITNGQKFNASNGWLWKYKIKMFTNFQKTPELDESGISFPYMLKKVVKDGKFLPQQVFTANETELYWKRDFAGTNFVKIKELNKNMCTLRVLLAANASGDFKLNPMLLYPHERPTFKDVDISELGVPWKNSRHKKFTPQMFEDWFKNHFVPNVYSYYEENNLDRKILLLINTNPHFSLKYFSFDDNVKVIFIPSRSTSYCSPINRSICTTFKSYYYYIIYRKLSKMWKTKLTTSASGYFKNYSLVVAIKYIRDAWQKVPSNLLNGAWFDIWPDVVQENADDDTNEEEFENILNSTLKYAEKVNIQHLNEDLLKEWISE